jgi:hypothetical protein
VLRLSWLRSLQGILSTAVSVLLEAGQRLRPSLTIPGDSLTAPLDETSWRTSLVNKERIHAKNLEGCRWAGATNYPGQGNKATLIESVGHRVVHLECDGVSTGCSIDMRRRGCPKLVLAPTGPSRRPGRTGAIAVGPAVALRAKAHFNGPAEQSARLALR